MCRRPGGAGQPEDRPSRKVRRIARASRPDPVGTTGTVNSRDHPISRTKPRGDRASHGAWAWPLFLEINRESHRLPSSLPSMRLARGRQAHSQTSRVVWSRRE